MADTPQFPWLDLAGRALTHAVAERGDVAGGASTASPSRDEEWTDNVVAVLNVCATTIRHFAPLEWAQGGAS